VVVDDQPVGVGWVIATVPVWIAWTFIMNKKMHKQSLLMLVALHSHIANYIR
jgi:hypothetical protein